MGSKRTDVGLVVVLACFGASQCDRPALDRDPCSTRGTTRPVFDSGLPVLDTAGPAPEMIDPAQPLTFDVRSGAPGFEGGLDWHRRVELVDVESGDAVDFVLAVNRYSAAVCPVGGLRPERTYAWTLHPRPEPSPNHVRAPLAPTGRCVFRTTRRTGQAPLEGYQACLGVTR